LFTTCYSRLLEPSKATLIGVGAELARAGTWPRDEHIPHLFFFLASESSNLKEYSIYP
jgi:hypothetical protein